MKRRNPMVTLGITSLFLIFSVLCLVILSLLTLNSSRTDLNMSRMAMEQTTAYYQACSEASDLCHKVDTYLKEAYQDTETESEYFSSVSGIGGLDDRISQTNSSSEICLSLPVTDTQELLVTLKVLYPSGPGDAYMEMISWKTGVTGDWTPDTKQHVYKGENP